MLPRGKKKLGSAKVTRSRRRVYDSRHFRAGPKPAPNRRALCGWAVKLLLWGEGGNKRTVSQTQKWTNGVSDCRLACEECEGLSHESMQSCARAHKHLSRFSQGDPWLKKRVFALQTQVHKQNDLVVRSGVLEGAAKEGENYFLQQRGPFPELLSLLWRQLRNKKGIPSLIYGVEYKHIDGPYRNEIDPQVWRSFSITHPF